MDSCYRTFPCAWRGADMYYRYQNEHKTMIRSVFLPFAKNLARITVAMQWISWEIGFKYNVPIASVPTDGVRAVCGIGRCLLQRAFRENFAVVTKNG